jgi:hypothetical protein
LPQYAIGLPISDSGSKKEGKKQEMTRRRSVSRIDVTKQGIPRVHNWRRYGLTLVALCFVAFWVSAGAAPTWATPVAQDSTPTADNHIFLPWVAQNAQSIGQAEGDPAQNNNVFALTEGEDQNANVPAQIDANVEASTFCSTYFRVSNYSSRTAYIYWVKDDGREVLYNALPGGYYYWQQSYYSHRWVIRDNVGNQLKSFTVNTCWYLYINIYDSDFPAPTPTSTPVPPQPLVSCPAGTVSLLTNGGFEAPTISSTWAFVAESSVPAWRTTATDDKIEIWRNNAVDAVPSYEGSQHNEINASSNSALYQDVATTPGTTIRWSFAHRGRNGVDTVQLRIGNTSTQAAQADFSTGKTWNNYTGTYVVPAGQTTTRIFFQPLAVASGNNSIGNLLDGVLVCQLPPATATPKPPPTNTPTAVPPTATATATATTAPVLTCPGNLVANGGFESGFNSWLVYDQAPRLALSTDAYSGSQAALLRGAPGSGVFMSQPIAVQAGATYNLSAVGKTSNGTVFSAIGLNFTDNNNVRLARTFVWVTAAAYTSGSASITAPIGTSFVEVYLATDGGSDFLADDICVTRSGGPTPTATLGPESVTLGDRVWFDATQNGLQDEAGNNLNNVKVELFEACDNTVPVATKLTNNGQYVFSNLAPGQYRIRVTAPEGLVFSPKGVGSDRGGDSDINPDGFSDCLTLGFGEQNFNIDAGLYQPGLPTPTATPSPTPIGGEIGDRVWNDLNRNGVQDTGEPSLEGVTVDLLNSCSGSSVYGTLTTSNSGQYIFRDLPAGQYLVRVTAPNGLVFSPQNAIADDGGDSDVDSNGITPCISLNPYEVISNVDAGLYDPQGTVPVPTATPTPAGATLGDRIWRDVNINGVQNVGEVGAGGVEVKLFSCATNQQIDATTSKPNGEYTFYPLAAGSYRIQVVAPIGFAFSPQAAIADNFADSDVDSSGNSACVTVNAFEEVRTVDAGIYDPSLPTPTATNTPLPPTATATLVPPTPTFTATPTATPTNTPTLTPTATNTPVPPTPTSTPGAPVLVTCPAGSTPLLINGSFEQPKIPSAWQLIDEAQVPGWLTNAGDNKIEIAQSGAYSVAAFDGVQFNELNASSAAALYQDIATTPGSTILWGFAHRGRNGTDTVSVRLGSPAGVAEQAKFNTANSVWLEYTGTYVVPNGQTTTRLELSPLSTAGNKANEGNLLDGIVVCQLR